MGTTRMLEALTLDSVKAKSIAHHLRLGDHDSHFNSGVSALQRLATIGDQVANVFREACTDREAGTDTYALQQALLELATTALIWTEVLDKHERLVMHGNVKTMLQIDNPSNGQIEVIE